jgi:transcriptional regulator with XRE-family HTH domain
MLNEKIKELRLSYGFNQAELASKLSISKQCVSNWESGYIQPSIDMLIKIARLFSVGTDYLLGLSDKQLVEVDGLSAEQIAHIRLLIKDFTLREA